MNKNRFGSITRAFIVLMLLIVAAFLTYNSDWFQKKYIYPYPYQSPIERYAKTYGVDPLLIVSIMKAESKFDPQASSEVGAVGLMQLMPDSGLWIAGEIGEPIDRDLLKNPEVSIKLGSWYIASLIDENDGNLVLALAAYNAGRGNVYTWVKEKKWPSNFNNCDSIPFKETRAFVKKVLGNYDNYKKLYRNEKQL